MQRKNSELSEKAKKIILDRMKDRAVDAVLRADNAEDFARVARKNLGYFYENLVFSSLDLGVNGGRVLDLGTQFGLCAISLAKQDYKFEITGFQESLKFADIGRNFAEEDMVDGKIRWVVGSQESLPFEDRSFDLVVSGFDMHHWENPVKVLNEVERVLKVKGALVIGDLRRDAFGVMMPLLKTFSYVVKNEKVYREMKASFASSYTKSEVEEILKNSNLRGCTVSKDTQFVYITREKKEKKHVLVRFA